MVAERVVEKTIRVLYVDDHARRAPPPGEQLGGARSRIGWR